MSKLIFTALITSFLAAAVAGCASDGYGTDDYDNYDRYSGRDDGNTTWRDKGPFSRGHSGGR